MLIQIPFFALFVILVLSVDPFSPTPVAISSTSYLLYVCLCQLSTFIMNNRLFTIVDMRDILHSGVCVSGSLQSL